MNPQARINWFTSSLAKKMNLLLCGPMGKHIRVLACGMLPVVVVFRFSGCYAQIYHILDRWNARVLACSAFRGHSVLIRYQLYRGNI